MVSKAFLVLVFALLAGCATAYQDMGVAGGHFEQGGPGQLKIVYFAANGYSDPKVVSIYGLYRCAELANEKHKAYFTIYQSLGDAVRGRGNERPVMSWIQGKPIVTAYVLFTDEARSGSQNTQDILSRYHDVIVSGKLNPA